MTFDMLASFRSDLPAASGTWQPPPEYSFVGGHNDAASVPFSGLAEALVNALRREGSNLAYYNLGGSPLGYRPLREFVASQLGARAGIQGGPDQVLMVSGSLQALDLVNNAMLTPGDTVLVEQATYGGMVSRIERMGVNHVGIELDNGGIVLDHLRSVLDELRTQDISPRYLYTIPTVQNPTGSVMPLDRRRALLGLAREYSLPIFEDECYADLTWGCERPLSLRALDGDGGQVIYCGSFSKSIAPALRVGYVIADEPVIRQLLALKTDAGTGSLEQLALAEYCPSNFTEHVDRLMYTLRTKADAMVAAVRSEFGDNVQVTEPMGGIYVWLTFPAGTNTDALALAANQAGIEFNPGSGWSSDHEWGKRRLRLCFGAPDLDTIRGGVAALAQVYRASL
ncbi:PLP-dependent aminotransferase family protein [Acidimicrobiales bacterium]|jgi:2-aminoadipate transaminase|nr:PLP-dependent aminotransferase family protein [Acidimicrobiales bacterium]HAY68108.1 aminotransferase [Acidimicrobiaceae bacterium]